MAFFKAARLEELWSGEMRGITLAGRKVLLVNLEGTVRAYEDRCAHLGVPLSEGRLEGTRLTCRAHHWQYDAATGRGLNPAAARLIPLATRVENGDVLVEIGPDAAPGGEPS